MKEQQFDTKCAAHEPPKELRENILSAIRAEKQRRKTLFIRHFAAAAAALLLITPAVTQLLPRLSPAPAEGAPAGTGMVLEPTDATGPAVLAGEYRTNPADEETVTPPPDYVGKTDTLSDPADSVVALSTGAVTCAGAEPADTAPPEMPLWMETVIRIVGEKAFKEWASLYEGDIYAPEAEAAAYAHFRLDV